MRANATRPGFFGAAALFKERLAVIAVMRAWFRAVRNQLDFGGRTGDGDRSTDDTDLDGSRVRGVAMGANRQDGVLEPTNCFSLPSLAAANRSWRLLFAMEAGQPSSTKMFGSKASVSALVQIIASLISLPKECWQLKEVLFEPLQTTQ